MNNKFLLNGGLLALITTSMLLGSLTFYYVFYLPYSRIREENWQKHAHMKATMCDSPFIPKDVHIDKMTHKGVESNCLEASVFLSTSIFWGTLSDMWGDSLIRFIIYGGNWQLQLLFGGMTFVAFIMIFQSLLRFIGSISIVAALTPSSTIVQPNGKRMAIVQKQGKPMNIPSKDEIAKILKNKPSILTPPASSHSSLVA
jgi:hypothetical protein